MPFLRVRSGCCRSAAGDTRQAALFCCLSFAGSLAFGHVVQEALNVIAGDGSNGKPAEKRLDMALDPALIDRQRARLLGLLTPR